MYKERCLGGFPPPAKPLCFLSNFEDQNISVLKNKAVALEASYSLQDILPGFHCEEYGF